MRFGVTGHRILPPSIVAHAMDHWRRVLPAIARLHGVSNLAAGQALVERCDHLFAVWDGRPARGLGGTADIVTYARTRGLPVTVLWVDGVLRA